MGFATKFIRAGEEITDTYCPTFAAIGGPERGQSLAKYNFVCNCTPCTDEWPTLEQLPRKFHGLPLQCYRIDSKEKVVQSTLVIVDLLVTRKLSTITNNPLLQIIFCLIFKHFHSKIVSLSYKRDAKPSLTVYKL